ncbi:MAG: Spx/MgsR family RNA polymerase-binding regulatory protein [Bacilli bacterium]|nr:Spx/MgsR family RNA polymerase-binding regulatory protein [Bacilli bacterium]
MLFIEYPKCSTCKKAKKYLINHNIDFLTRDITKDIPTKEELKKYLSLTEHKNINKFFNTSGMKYRELNLKDKLSKMTEEEKIDLLSKDGMLIKRPLLILDNSILIGYKEKEYQKIKE